AAPSAKGDDKFITTDYLQQCQKNWAQAVNPTQAAIFSCAGKGFAVDADDPLLKNRVNIAHNIAGFDEPLKEFYEWMDVSGDCRHSRSLLCRVNAPD
ncbi:hypothetical protein, partial [Klebsiella pneumoniae]